MHNKDTRSTFHGSSCCLSKEAEEEAALLWPSNSPSNRLVSLVRCAQLPSFVSQGRSLPRLEWSGIKRYANEAAHSIKSFCGFAAAAFELARGADGAEGHWPIWSTQRQHQFRSPIILPCSHWWNQAEQDDKAKRNDGAGISSLHSAALSSLCAASKAIKTHTD